MCSLGKMSPVMLQSFVRALQACIGEKASSLEHNSEWRQAAEGGELLLMVGSCVGEASHWLHVPFVRWGPTFRPMLLRMREIPASSSSIDGGNKPRERQLTPMFSPTASHGEGTWWWCSPLEFISGLDMRSEQMLTLAVGNRADLLDKCWVLNVQVQPGTGHVFWRGQEVEQQLRGPIQSLFRIPRGKGRKKKARQKTMK